MAVVVVVGYASLDSSTAVEQFRGLDATSILTRSITTPDAGIGGIAHIAAASAATGVETEALSWVAPDDQGVRWIDAVQKAGSGTVSVSVTGTRSPNATLIEVGSGGTICLFDPGDCHPAALSVDQSKALHESDWIVLTVTPRQIAAEALREIPAHAKLVWAVKHDDAAYTPEMIDQIIARADVISFSAGERAYLTSNGLAPEQRAKHGALVIETQGSRGVSWAMASQSSTPATVSIRVDPVNATDTTGAGDTFIGTLVGLLSQTTMPTDPEDASLRRIISAASSAAGDLLRSRATPGHTATAPQGSHIHVDH